MFEAKSSDVPIIGFEENAKINFDLLSSTPEKLAS